MRPSSSFGRLLVLLGTLGCSAFLAPQSPRRSAIGGRQRDLGARRGSTSSSGEFDFSGAGSLFASSSNGWPSIGDGFPSIGSPSGAGVSSAGAATADGFPSLGEMSISRPRRGVLIQNMPADANHKIRILDRGHKLGITAVVETIAVVKDTRFALCRTKDRAAAILDDFVFPVDVDSQAMPALVKRANRRLAKQGVELLWTAHTLTVRGLERPATDYLSWKKPFNVQKALEAAFQQAATGGATAEGGGSSSEGGFYAGGGGDEMAMGDEFAAAAAEGASSEEEDEAASLDRLDAAFFADVNDEDYAADAAEGLDKRSPLLETEMLCEFEHKRAKYRVVVHEEPVAVLAQWMDDGTWRLLKSVEADIVQDAIAFKGLQTVDVEMVDA